MTITIKHEEQQQKVELFRKMAETAIRSKCYGAMTVEEATNLMLSAADLGVSPMKALNGGFHIIKGKICMAGHLISDRIRSGGHSVKVVEQSREKCVIIGVRKDNGDSCKVEFDMEDAKLAGLLDSPTWKKYPKDMLYNRAISRLGRVLFSDVVGSCYSEDEGHDIAGTPPKDRPLADMDEDITLEIKPHQHFLTDDQVDNIEMLLQTIPDVRPKFLAWMQAQTVEDIKPENYEKAVSSLKSRIKERGLD